MLTHLQNIDVSVMFFFSAPLSLSYPMKSSFFIFPRASAFCTQRYPRAWNNCTSLPNDAIIQKRQKKKKKWTGLLCRFKFRNRREEKYNSRALRRQSYSRVKGGEIEGCLFFCVTCSEKLNASIVPPRIKPFGTAVCGQFVLCFWPIQKVVWKLKLPDNVSLSVLLLLQYLIMKNNSLKACWIIFPK